MSRVCRADETSLQYEVALLLGLYERVGYSFTSVHRTDENDSGAPADNQTSLLGILC